MEKRNNPKTFDCGMLPVGSSTPATASSQPKPYTPQVGDLFEYHEWPNHPILVIKVAKNNVLVQDTVSLEFLDCIDPHAGEWEAVTLISRISGEL